ncbi:putative WRKY transcription factor 54 [Apostasia shenzhenica]|uniref:Putative WRKY transcription factor 54 n=1 Tax=Apostasia shenzhenica TaxID=1088818 RepID=A0A2I0BGR4_9ASPA|nr:putative WRKY transcription factor 54 [Apostasia shenzhenica]
MRAHGAASVSSTAISLRGRPPVEGRRRALGQRAAVVDFGADRSQPRRQRLREAQAHGSCKEKLKEMAARRKEMRTWRTITSAPYHDGHQWRKYGQKNIQNSIHPRSYYRCTYKDGQGCLASKQVQQIDGDDSSRFIVVYSNEHTCRSRPPAWARVEHFDVGDEQSQMLRFGERTKEAAVAPACFSGGGEAVPSSSSSSSDQHDHVRAAINGDERACYLDEFAFGECSSLNL